MFRALAAKLAIVALAGALAGCDDDDPQIIPPPVGQAPAALRVVHAAPTAPAIDIYAAGIADPLVENLSYGEASPYIDVAAGTQTLEVRPAGANPETDPVFVSTPIDLAQSTEATVVAAGILNGPDGQDFRLLPLDETFTVPQNRALLRLVHAAPDAPAMAIDLGDDGSVEIDDLARFEASDAAGIPVPAGQPLQVAVLAADTRQRLTAFTTPALPAGDELFVVATGLLMNALPRQAQGFVLLPVDRDDALGFIRQNPTIFALHGSPDAGQVDIAAMGVRLANDLSFGELSEPIQLAPGSYELEFWPPEATFAPAATLPTPELLAGERYLAVATGFLTPEEGEPSFQLVTALEEFALDQPDASQLRFIHASPDAPAVNIGQVENGQLMSPMMADDLSFAEVADEVEVPTGDLEVGVAPAGDTTPLAVFPFTTEAGMRVFAVAIGALTPQADEQPISIAVVETSVFPWTVSLQMTP